MGDCVYVEPRPGIVALSGELALSSAKEIKELLLRLIAMHPKLEVDLLNVTRLDTAGVQVLLLAQREATRQGKPLGWLGYSLAVEEVLELLDLSSTLGQPAAVVWG